MTKEKCRVNKQGKKNHTQALKQFELYKSALSRDCITYYGVYLTCLPTFFIASCSGVILSSSSTACE